MPLGAPHRHLTDLRRQMRPAIIEFDGYEFCPSWSLLRRRAGDDTGLEIALGHLSKARS